MKKMQRGTIKYLVWLIIGTAVFGLVLYPLFDLVFCKFLTKTAFDYSVSKHVVQPILFAIIYGISFWALDKKRK